MTTPLHTTPKHKGHRSSGQALAEFSLIMPVLMFIVFGIIDYGRVLFVFSMASSSIRDAARNAEILGMDGSTPSYANCNLILTEARDVLFVNMDALTVHYYNTDDGVYNIASPDFSCEDDSDGDDDGIPEVTPTSVINGDIMIVEMNTTIEFVTPFLSNLWSSIDLNFRAQRSIVVQFVLNDDDGNDIDFDGLRDDWEFQWFGCWTGDGAFVMRPDGVILNPSASYADTGNTGTFPTDCDPLLDSAGDPVFDDDGNPVYRINLEQYNATDNPDGDGCNNGCEETRSTQPINLNNLPAQADDTDGDGLTDDEEAFVYVTDPIRVDTDGDGVNDGVEVNPGALHPFGATIPHMLDLNSDGTPDGPDSDMDGLLDGEEIYGTPQTNPNDPDTDADTLTDYQEVRTGFLLTLVVNGFPQAPKRVYTDPTLTDTDGDGLSDYDELFVLPITDPTLWDTDGDGLSDGEEILTYGTDALDSDSDRDGLNDGMEVNPALRPAPGDTMGRTYFNNVNSDGDACTDLLGDPKFLSDYDEIFIFGTNPTYEDLNTDGQPDGRDTDGDGLDDCEEVYVYNTNPNNPDTDGDDNGSIACNDAEELSVGTDPRVPGDCPPAATPVDSDGDGLWDEWELRYFPDLLTATGNGAGGGSDNNDTDLCNNVCEQNQGTNPTLDDTDGDGLDDHLELPNFSDPLLTDTDGDGLNDYQEVLPASAFPGWPYAASNPRRVNSDTDNLTDFEEVTIHQTNPNHPDTDGDGVIDHCEVNPIGCGLANAATNPRLADTDNDGLNDFQEIFIRGTNPTNADSDSDGIQDGAEVNTYTTNPVIADTDNDGLTDGQEINGILGYTMTFLNPPGGTVTIDLPGYDMNNPNSKTRLNPFVADVDGDGLKDGVEVNTVGSNPLNVDTDGDSLTDGFEYNDGDVNSEPMRDDSGNVNLDTDGDGIPNIEEETGVHGYVTDPTLVDSDDDRLTDYEEMITGVPLQICVIDKAGATRDGRNNVVANCAAAPIYNYFTNATHLDQSPIDGIPDGFDTDKDGLDDFYETDRSFALGNGSDSPLDPTLWDTDRDGLSDLQEVIRYNTNPVNAQVEKTLIDAEILDAAFITNVFEVANQGQVSTAISNASLGLGYTVSGNSVLFEIEVRGQNGCSPGLSGNNKNYCFTPVQTLISNLGGTYISQRVQSGRGYITALVPITVVFELISNTDVLNIKKG